MRSLLFAALLLAALAMTGSSASAADGCGYDRYGRLYCAPGAYPGVPYYGPRNGYEPYYGYEDPYYRRRYYRYRCRPGEISIGGGKGRICIRIRI